MVPEKQRIFSDTMILKNARKGRILTGGFQVDAVLLVALGLGRFIL